MNKYMRFYVDGFNENGRKCLVKTAEIDFDLLGAVLAKRSPEMVIAELVNVAVKEGAALDTTKLSKKWIDANRTEIDLAGGDGRLAYAAFCRGQIDCLIQSSIDETVDGIADALGLPTDEDDEDDEDEDDEEEIDD